MNKHRKALEITRLVHERAGASQTFLFGSREPGATTVPTPTWTWQSSCNERQRRNSWRR